MELKRWETLEKCKGFKYIYIYKIIIHQKKNKIFDIIYVVPNSLKIFNHQAVHSDCRLSSFKKVQ